MKRLIFPIAIIVFSLNLLSQDKSAPERENYEWTKIDISSMPGEIIEKCDSFFNIAVNQGFEKAMNYIFENSPISSMNVEYIKLLNEVLEMQKVYSLINLWELSKVEKNVDHHYRIEYVSNYKGKEYEWELTFCISPSFKWVLKDICVQYHYECIKGNVKIYYSDFWKLPDEVKVDKWLDEYEKFLDEYIPMAKKAMAGDAAAAQVLQKFTAKATEFANQAEQMGTKFTPEQGERALKLAEKAMSSMK